MPFSLVSCMPPAAQDDSGQNRAMDSHQSWKGKL